MELKTLLKAVEIAGSFGAVLFICLYISWRFSSEVLKKIPAPAKAESSGIIKLMLSFLALLSLAGLVAYIYQSDNAVKISTSPVGVQVQTSPKGELPPIVINHAVVHQSAIDGKALDRIENQAKLLTAQDQVLAEERNARQATDQTLSRFQYANIKQNVPIALDLLNDLARLRNYRVPIEVFVNRWRHELPSEQRRAVIIDQALVGFGFAKLDNENIAVTEKGMAALAANGGVPAAFVVFDRPTWCADAKRSIDLMICESENLSRSERQVLSLYSNDKLRRGQVAINEQTIWRRDVRDRCTTSECLNSVYGERIAALTQER